MFFKVIYFWSTMTMKTIQLMSVLIIMMMILLNDSVTFICHPVKQLNCLSAVSDVFAPFYFPLIILNS